MRGTKVKALRTDDRPHPGRLHGGNFTQPQRKFTLPWWLRLRKRVKAR